MINHTKQDLVFSVKLHLALSPIPLAVSLIPNLGEDSCYCFIFVVVVFVVIVIVVFIIDDVVVVILNKSKVNSLS